MRIARHLAPRSVIRLSSRVVRSFLVGAWVVFAVACHSNDPEPLAAKPPAASVIALDVSAPAATASGAPKNAARVMPARLVAIGDLHGDLDAARRAMRLAGAIDAKDAWIGDKLVVVQTGDEIDRSDDDRAVLDLFERLKNEAPKSGGEVVALVGNHEIMNASLDFRYVTPRAYAAFADVPALASVSSVEPSARPRASAFAPGGPYATLLARRPVIARVGDTLFVHGGVLPKHVTVGLDAINDATREWLSGSRAIPRELTAEDGPLWTRAYSAAPGREECAMLDDVLASTAAKRMVMGHTVQRSGASSACAGKAWRIDVGMAKVFAGSIQVLAIEGGAVTVLSEPK
ncbi:hypothetical protein BH09MYX1_BH09MYX1_33500 [soil metagenome]